MRKRTILITLCTAVAAAIVYEAAVASRSARLTPVGQALDAPADAREVAGAWYWIERPQRGKARLVWAAHGAVDALATADEITGYGTDGKTTVWTQRDGSVWSVKLAGAAPRTIWSGKDAVEGPWIAGGEVYWLQVQPAVAAPDVPDPSLGPSLHLMSCEAASDQPRELSSLMESAGRVIGVTGGSIWVAADRSGFAPQTAIYRVPTAGGIPVRAAGEAGLCVPIVTRVGLLCWPARSREASDRTMIACVRCLGRDGQLRTLAEFLPMDGRLYDTSHGLEYVDATVPAAGWWDIHDNTRLPQQHRGRYRYVAVAVGPDAALIEPLGPDRGPRPLFECALP